MKTKTSHLLFSLALIILLTVVLTACGHQHTYGEWVTEKEASCLEDGQRTRVCSECGEKETAFVLAKGHTEGEWVIDTDATCTTDGSKHLACAVCEAVIKTETIAQGHTEGEWAIDADATCTTDGSKHLACAVCNATLKTETIAAKGHTDGQWVTDVNATCEKNGSKHQVCSVCNDTLKTESIPATGKHNYTGKVTAEASCAGNGVKTFTCSGCGKSYTESISSKVYSATELYELYNNSVGEVITYNKNGQEHALGTCFVYSSDGKIITNYHVIEDAYSAKILLGGKEYQVQQVLAYDKNKDIAVLKISASGLSPAKLCERSHKVGEVVYAIGSSKGLTATFSDGMITYSNRVIDGVSYTQHDAPISSGNSGGPLINKYGEVIGINTWTVRDSQNLNFAINVLELNGLNYSSPLTMAEFYQKECDVFSKLKNYIIENGTYNRSDDCYSVVCDVSYSSDYTDKFTRMAYYYVSEDVITLDFLINDGECWAYFEVDKNLSGAYSWKYFDDHDYKMSGTLYASTYDDNTLLGYNYCNVSYTSIKDSIRSLASTMISGICSGIDAFFAPIGVTAEDLQFYCY